MVVRRRVLSRGTGESCVTVVGSVRVTVSCVRVRVRCVRVTGGKGRKGEAEAGRMKG